MLGIKQEQSQPVTMGLRILPGLLYGSDHAYSGSFTGSGTEASVKAITSGDLEKYHHTWFAPNNAVLVVVGDVNADELKTKLEKSFASWKKEKVPEKNINEEAHKLAEKDMSHDKDINKMKDENADLDEGELARKEGHP